MTLLKERFSIDFIFIPATLNPYPWIFETITERVFWKKKPELSLVTSQLELEKWKLYVQIECQLGYIMMLISNGISYAAYANMRGNMPCWTKIYMLFFGTVTERGFREKIQSAALHHLCMFLCFGFFPESALGDGPKKWHIFLFSTAYFPS